MAIAVTHDYKADVEQWMQRFDVHWYDIRDDLQALQMYGFRLLVDNSLGMVEFRYDLLTNRMQQRIKTHPVETEDAYFAAMHELGHVANEDWKRLPTASWGKVLPHEAANLLRAEAEAWAWAYENAIVTPSDYVLQSTQAGFYSYIRDYGREHVPPKHELHPYLQEV